LPNQCPASPASPASLENTPPMDQVAGHPRHSGHEIQSFVEVGDFEE
jgi:hypothetical protein